MDFTRRFIYHDKVISQYASCNKFSKVLHEFSWRDSAIRAQLMHIISNELAGLPALRGGESGQVRKEAATTTYCKCRGKARLLFRIWSGYEKHRYQFKGGINKES
jgi:hypothetical protein